MENYIGKYNKQISLKEYPKAIYMFEIQTDYGIVNQKIILHFCFYLKKIKVLLPVWSCFLLFSKKTYKLNYLNSNYFLIRLGLISAIMVGVCKSKQLRNYQNLDHLK